jgi:hypothetical protein
MQPWIEMIGPRVLAARAAALQAASTGFARAKMQSSFMYKKGTAIVFLTLKLEGLTGTEIAGKLGAESRSPWALL